MCQHVWFYQEHFDVLTYQFTFLCSTARRKNPEAGPQVHETPEYSYYGPKHVGQIYPEYMRDCTKSIRRLTFRTLDCPGCKANHERRQQGGNDQTATPAHSLAAIIQGSTTTIEQLGSNESNEPSEAEGWHTSFDYQPTEATLDHPLMWRLGWTKID